MNENLKSDPRYKNHESRPDLAGEHPLGDTYQMIGMAVFVIAIIVDLLWVKSTVPLKVIFGSWIRLSLGLAVMAFGGWLALYGIHIVFSEYTEEPRMITRHLFSAVRHPVYLGAIVVYIGLLIITLSPLGIIVFIGIIFLYDWLARDEEARMLKIFGDRYRAYIHRVPRWLPRFFGSKPDGSESLN